MVLTKAHLFKDFKPQCDIETPKRCGDEEFKD